MVGRLLLSMLAGMLVWVAGATNAFGCGFGTTEFACCRTSPIVGAPETRILSGCEISRATALTRCVAVGIPSADLRFVWGDNQCRSGNGGDGSAEISHHACSVARHGSGSFTFYAWGPKSQTSREQICAKARQANNTGRSATHSWYTTFSPGRMHKAIAECENGTWVAYAQGVQSIHKVNDLRKQHGGRGCLFKVDKSWQP